MKLTGRNALVTGASRGIGRACAVELARQGANVGINFRSHPEEAEEVAKEVRAAGAKAILLRADVADLKSVEEMVAKMAAELGSVDFFVSNAAYSDRQLMLEADMEGFRRTIDVTMWGAFHGLRASARQMVKQGRGGSIVIVSSPHAVLAIPTAMAYNMSKAAIVSASTWFIRAGSTRPASENSSRTSKWPPAGRSCRGAAWVVPRKSPRVSPSS
jgi:glucose 1-dehydrogenase